MKACLLLFFYFSFICQLHGADVKIKQNESMMGSTAMTYDLSEEKLMKLKYKSQHGDSEASFRLYQYYCFTKNNIYKQLRFLERSASQGNVTAQFNYGVFLSDTNPTLSEYYNLNRAIYWMEFAVNNGNIDAKSKLQELKISEDGNTAWSAEYDEWGNQLNEENPHHVYQPYRLPGQQHDEESGLYYNYYR